MSVSSSKRMAAPMSVSSSKRMRTANHPQVVGQQPFVPQFQQRCHPSPFALNQAQRQVHPSQGHGVTCGFNPIPGAYFPSQGHGVTGGFNPIPGANFPSQGQGVTGWSNPMPGPGAYFPSNACPPANQIPDVNAFSGLISSLISRGLISFSNQTTPAAVAVEVEVEVEGSAIGLKLDPQLLKVRHESAIRALYVDLPRQCKSCGLRFKCQEEHSRHMDWHVSRNRTNKNHLKHKHCRQWFATSTMWLSGAAETLSGSGYVPPTDAENNDHLEEMVVPADEDQTVCALCGDRFDDFYSDETEDWMYKGAVYLNAPNTSTAAAAAMDRSQLGPIVHAKCK